MRKCWLNRAPVGIGVETPSSSFSSASSLRLSAGEKDSKVDGGEGGGDEGGDNSGSPGGGERHREEGGDPGGDSGGDGAGDSGGNDDRLRCNSSPLRAHLVVEDACPP